MCLYRPLRAFMKLYRIQFQNLRVFHLLLKIVTRRHSAFFCLIAFRKSKLIEVGSCKHLLCPYYNLKNARNLQHVLEN